LAAYPACLDPIHVVTSSFFINFVVSDVEIIVTESPVPITLQIKMPNVSAIKEFARQLLVYEAATGTSPAAGESAVFRVCEKLRGRLSVLIGTDGFRLLLSRAVSIAGAGRPWLSALIIRPDGSLGGLDDLEAALSVQMIVAGEVALVAQLLELLVTFIGPALTLQLLRDIWPKMEKLGF
jgi:hypothetical protein